MLLELIEMFFPLIGYIIVLQKRFNQFDYEFGKSICRIYFGLLFFSHFIHFWFAPSFYLLIFGYSGLFVVQVDSL